MFWRKDPRTECAIKICHNQASVKCPVITGLLDVEGQVVAYLCLTHWLAREVKKAERIAAQRKPKVVK